MTHLVVFLSFIGLVCILYLIRPKWTYFGIIPLAILGGVIGGLILYQNLIEGTTAYIMEMLTIFCGAVFVYMLKSTGSLESLIFSWIQIGRKNRYLMLLGLITIGLIPGMGTGSALFSFFVLNTVMLPIIRQCGVGKAQIKSLLLTTAVLGMMAPPVNIPLMILKPFSGGANADVYPFLWLVVIPGVLFSALYFMRHCRFDQEKIKHLPNRKTSAGDFSGIVFVGILLVLRGLFPFGEIEDIGLPLIFMLGVCLQWMVSWDKKESFFSISQQALTATKPLLLLLVGCSLVMQVTHYTAAHYVIVGLAKNLPFVYAMVLLILVGIVFGSLWEGLAAIVVMPIYIAHYSKDIVSSLDVFSAVVACIICIGMLLPIGWNRPVFETGTFENKMAGLTIIPAFFLLVWMLLVYWKVGIWFNQFFLS